MIRRPLVACFASLALIAGCGRSTTVSDAEGNKATVTEGEKGTEVTVRGADGSETKFASGESVPLPKECPKDVSLFPGARVAVASSNPQGFLVSLESKSSVGDVTDWYEKQLAQDGWTIDSATRAGDGSALSAKKGESRVVTVVVGKADEGSQTTLSVTK